MLNTLTTPCLISIYVQGCGLSHVSQITLHRLSYSYHNLLRPQLPRRLQQQGLREWYFGLYLFRVIQSFFFGGGGGSQPHSCLISNCLGCCPQVRKQRNEHPPIQLPTPPLLAPQLYGCVHLVTAVCCRKELVLSLCFCLLIHQQWTSFCASFRSTMRRKKTRLPSPVSLWDWLGRSLKVEQQCCLTSFRYFVYEISWSSRHATNG